MGNMSNKETHDEADNNIIYHIFHDNFSSVAAILQEWSLPLEWFKQWLVGDIVVRIPQWDTSTLHGFEYSD